jgi:hypothetical protein
VKYLSKEPIVFGMSQGASISPEVTESGGPATVIPEEDKCSSGRHSKRLAQCWCHLFGS